MSSNMQEITLEQPGQDPTGLVIREDSGTRPFDFSNGSDAQVNAVKNPYDILDCLMQILSPAHSLDTLLHSLATLVRRVMSMDMCIVLLADAAYSFLTLRAASPDLNSYDMRFTPLELDRVPWKKLRVFNSEGQLPGLTIREQEQLNPLQQVQYEMLLAVPLSVGNEDLGLLLCYSSKNRDYSMEDQVLLRSITSQVSLAIQNRQLAQTPTFRNPVAAFFDDLLSARPGKEESLRGRANSLGCDLTRPHIMLTIEMMLLSEPADSENHSHNQAAAQTHVPMLQTNAYGSDEEKSSRGTKQSVYDHAARFITYRIQEHYPGSLVDERENALFCIVPLNSSGDLHTWLRDLIHQVQREQRVHMFAGIGNPYADIQDYKKGFDEAEAALLIGQHLQREAGISHFNDLGVYRYIYEFASSNTLDDIYLEKIAAITCYDQQRKRSELLDTLEIYLETGCNIKDASKRLRVHRNTIIQRLKHIQSLCAVNLDQPAQRLWLQIALMVHKLRRDQASFCLRSDKTMST